MGMSAWGLLAAPLMAAEMPAHVADMQEPLVAVAVAAADEELTPADLVAAQELAAAAGELAASADELALSAGELAPSTEIFGELAAMDDGAMSAASGGASVAIDISNLGVNIAENEAQVENTNVNNSVNGDIANNTVSGNGGITTVFNNTGNGVIFQSTVNVNIFTGGSQ